MREVADLVVVGAGAAGLMAAIHAAERGVGRTLVFERSRDGGRKILISGGGRCNVLPSRLDPADFVTASSPNSLRKLLLSWPLAEQRRYFEKVLDIPLALEEETGKLFPVSNKARHVRDRLVEAARDHGADFHFEHSVEGLRQDPDGLWTLDVTPMGTVRSRAVLLATGGLSVPATGSDGTGLRILEGLGHTIHDLYPALTPLTADPPPHGELAGISLDVTMTAPRAPRRPTVRGGFLFTHRGWSGPTVLNLSHIAIRGEGEGLLEVRWSHESAEEWDRRLRDAGQEEGASVPVGGFVRRALPQRLADRLLHEAGVPPETPLARFPRADRERLSALLGAYPLPWTGDEGYRKAEVTGGGLALAEVHPKRLESRSHPGLFLAGELLDAFGPIGGYNFAWAWATGRMAGRGAADYLRQHDSGGGG